MPRRPKQDLAQVEDLTPPDEPAIALDEAGPELSDHIGRSFGRPIGRRLGVSVPGAIGGALLVCTLAFGASLGATGRFDGRDASAAGAGGCVGADCDTGFRIDGNDDETPSPTADGGEGQGPDGQGADAAGPDGQGADGQGADAAGPDGTEAPAADETTAPEPDKTEKPEQAPTERSEPKPTPKAEPTPAERPELGLTLSIKEGAVLVDWTACEVDGAQAYKVVRSSDATVRWPAGDNDALVAVVEVGNATKAWDEHAPAGKKIWYRVFCVRHTDDGTKVLSASEAKSIRTPEKPEPTPTPTPEPEHLSIDAGVEGGHIVIHWEACGGESFSHYRVLRKTSGDATLLTEIENAGTTTYVDASVEPGVEYHYLVQCKGHSGDGYILLGATDWVAATVE